MNKYSFEIKNSNISGKGVFNKIKIKKGESICFLEGEVCSLDEIIKRVNEGKEGPADPLLIGKDIYIDLNQFSRSVNHSCNPNAYVNGENELVALRDIKIGEEITYDYSTTMNDNEEKIVAAGRSLWTCKCSCGAKNCRGIINQFRTLPKKIQNYYIKNRFMPDFMLEIFSL